MRGREEQRGAEARRVAPEPPVRADEVRHVGRGQGGAGLDEGEVQPDAQAGGAARDLHRLGGGGRRHHQARGREDAVPVGALDRGVDLGREAEVVGGDDEVLGHGDATLLPPAGEGVAAEP